MPLAEHDNVVKTFPPDRLPFHNIRSATAIAARLADPECSSPEGRGATARSAALTIGGALGVGLPMTLKTPLRAAIGCVIEILW
jgi:hypothetical protein